MFRARRCAPSWSVLLLLPLLALLPPRTCSAQATDSLARADSIGAKATPLVATRITSPIVVDGDLSDAGWQGVPAVTRWFETNVGDNVEPQVANLAYLAYDESHFYAGFRFEDPDPAGVRAPLGDRDQLSGATDYAGVIIDGNNDGKTAQMFLANARGLLYDALTSDASGEDNAPDYYWDAMGKRTATGWDLEIRVPFSTLRYKPAEIATWRILLYRNYPRDRRYQFFSARLPRDSNCFVCNSTPLTGLTNLPSGSHLVVAPFVTATRQSAPSAGLGSPLEAEDIDPDAGVDVKWNPGPSAAIDLTVNPDFSQVESDVAQIAANERFALFFPEKRPFFLEGVDLFSTPFAATYTRTITAPRAGARTTGRFGPTAYTALFTHDEGGGSVIIPGPDGSSFADQDFESDVAVLRLRRDLGTSFVSILGTTRELDGPGYNRVFGPDFQWRPKPTDAITGQFLYADTRTPERPDLATEWDGRQLSDRAFRVDWSHSTRHEDWYIASQDIGVDFRDDNGFIPQVGFQEAYLSAGYTFRPSKSFFNRIRLFTDDYIDAEHDGDVLARRVSVGSGMNGKLNSFARVEFNQDEFRVQDQLSGEYLLLSRFRPRLRIESSPTRLFNNFFLDIYAGDEIDFDNAQEGSGATISTGFSLRPNDHLELRTDLSRRWLDVPVAGAGDDRLFTAGVERLRATWQFDARSFLRLIGQYVHTERDPSLYEFGVPEESANLSFSGLFAYKLNWQTVFFLGYGDQRVHDPVSQDLEPASNSAFVKVSYAWQR